MLRPDEKFPRNDILLISTDNIVYNEGLVKHKPDRV